MKKLMLMFCACACGQLFVSGCEILSDSATFELVLPEPLSRWQETFPGLSGELLVIDTDGEVTATDVALGPASCSARIRKDSNGLVLLYPRTPAGNRLIRPYGAILPASFDETANCIRLSPEGGFVAERLYNLVRKGISIELFNSERLINLLIDKGGDPFDFDPLLVETAIAGGSFTTYSLKKLPCREVNVVLSAGTWFSESPCSAFYVSNGGDSVSGLALTYGFHTLFKQGTPDFCDLFVSERDVVVFTP